MSKDIPYFKFFTSEWMNGEITLEDYELQGIFVNLCAYYWHRECSLNMKQAEKKLKTKRITELIEIEIISETNGILVIEFLDEQFEEFFERRERLSKAGKKGALSKARKKLEQTTLKPPLNKEVSNPSTLREDKKREDKKREDNTESLDFSKLLEYYNSLFNRRCTVVPQKAKTSLNARIKEGFTKLNILTAMKNVKDDEWHKENNYKFATITYFSQTKTLDSHGYETNKKTKKYVPR